MEEMIATRAPAAEVRVGRRLNGRGSWPPVVWAAVAGCVILASVAWVVLTRMRPAYDTFGWLVWGRQVLHWNLNTDGAPSWKPLTFVFTLPYALAGANPQMWLWMITATAATLAGSVFAARIAYRLTGPAPQRPWAPWAAAVFAGVGVLGIDGYSGLVLIANSDPVVVSLCLAAIDAHLSGYRRLAFVLLVLVSLGRPEGWAFAGLYGVWAWRTVPSMRALVVGGLALIPLAWFVVPALTSHSWFISGDLALGSPNVIHGNKILGVLGRVRGLYEWPMQLAVLCTLVYAAVRRDRALLALAAAALLWVAIEIAFALHGWSAVRRYLFEPGAVLVVIAAVGVGRLLAYRPKWSRALQWAPIVLVGGLVIALLPAARSRAQIAHGEIDDAHRAATQLSALQAAIDKAGGSTQIQRCGQPVALLAYQSELAWVLGENVGSIGWQPQRSIAARAPIVLFTLAHGRWQISPIHTRTRDTARCEKVRTSSVT
jgi:hypothetical protein